MINFYKENVVDSLDKMHDFVDHYKALNYKIKKQGEHLEAEIKDFKVLID